MKTLIRARRDWTTRPIDSRCTRQTLDNPTLFVHYSETDGRKLKTKSQQTKAIAAIWNFHVYGRGWYDIGYSYILAQPWGPFRLARVWVGRGKNYVPASQEGHNTGNVSVCVLAGPGDGVKVATINAIAQLAKELGVSAIEPHCAVNATDCPGHNILQAIPAIRKKAAL